LSRGDIENSGGGGFFNPLYVVGGYKLFKKHWGEFLII